MSKAIKRLNAYGMGGTFDQPGYEYDAVNDTFKDLESGKVFSKEYVAPTGGTGTVTPTVKLETNKEVSITENGEVEITPTSGKDAMEKVTANVAVPVPVLEDNKAASIDVSQYTEPVEITPTQGKDGMKKNTITLTNIPQSNTSAPLLYGWSLNVYNTTTSSTEATYDIYLTCDTAPETTAAVLDTYALEADPNSLEVLIHHLSDNLSLDFTVETSNHGTEFLITTEGAEISFERKTELPDITSIADIVSYVQGQYQPNM